MHRPRTHASAALLARLPDHAHHQHHHLATPANIPAAPTGEGCLTFIHTSTHTSIHTHLHSHRCSQVSRPKLRRISSIQKADRFGNRDELIQEEGNLLASAMADHSCTADTRISAYE